MTLLLAVDAYWGIGMNGDMLYHLPGDLKRFRELTTQNIIVMGRKTYESLPRRPLSRRLNLVLTGNREYEAPGAVVVHDLEELEEIADRLAENKREIFLIGGGHLVRQLLDHCDRALITFVDATTPADTTVPNLDEDPRWKLMHREPAESPGDFAVEYREYRKTAVV